ncbi:PDR/VanB family oxidoreductase [soil metagenome]
MEQPTRVVTVLDRTDEADGVISLTFAGAGGGPLPEWTPGAHLDLILGNGLIRQYSLSSDPADLTRYRLGVLREPASRGGSIWIYDNVHAGSTLAISQPRNNFVLHHASGYRFVAGGIGITPILPMIRRAEAESIPWTLLYGGRTRQSMAFLRELEAYGDKVMVRPQDEFGLLDLATYFADPSEGELIYACGPEPMLLAAERASAAWPVDALHVERFVPKHIDVAPDEAFEVEFVESGITAEVPAGVSILDVAEQFSLNVFSSCREGTCGTCETRVLEGAVEHRDSLLTVAEQEAGDTMMICVSRAAHGCPKLRLAL